MSRYLSQLMGQTGLKITSRPNMPASSSQSGLAPVAPVIPARSLTEEEAQSENESMTPNLSKVEARVPRAARLNSVAASQQTTTVEQLEEATIEPARLGPSSDPTVRAAHGSHDSQESKCLSLVEKEELHASPVDTRRTFVSRPSGLETLTSESAVPIPRAGPTLQRVRAWLAVASGAPEPPSPARISTPRDAEPATRTVASETTETRDVEEKSASKVTSSSPRVSLPGIAVRPRLEGSASPSAELEENRWSVNIGALHLEIEAARGKTSLRPAASRPAQSTASPRTNSSRLWRYYLRPF
jgi:hypothetical protein